MKKVLPTMVLLATVGTLVFAGGGAQSNQGSDSFQPNKGRGGYAQDSRMGYGYFQGTENLENQEPGIVITQVVPDTPAAEAGIQRGDILLTFNGTEVNSFFEINPLLEDLEAGQEVSLGLTRAGQALSIQVELETLLNAPLIGIMGQGQRPDFEDRPEGGLSSRRGPMMSQSPGGRAPRRR